jgi:hypothetical protein
MKDPVEQQHWQSVVRILCHAGFNGFYGSGKTATQLAPETYLHPVAL